MQNAKYNLNKHTHKHAHAQHELRTVPIYAHTHYTMGVWIDLGLHIEYARWTGNYQPYQPIEVSAADTTTNSAMSAAQQQQQKSEELSRLSGSEFKSSGFISSSSLAIASIGGGGGTQSATVSVASNSNIAGSGAESSTPTQHRRLAKSFSVAPSLSQTSKGW